MKLIKAKELRQKSANELGTIATEHRAALRSFRFGISGSKTKNVREGRNTRRSLARSLTILKEKNAK
jgi:ribosomal protein L29